PESTDLGSRHVRLKGDLPVVNIKYEIPYVFNEMFKVGPPGPKASFDKTRCDIDRKGCREATEDRKRVVRKITVSIIKRQHHEARAVSRRRNAPQSLVQIDDLEAFVPY